jgi:hypothetical protein
MFTASVALVDAEGRQGTATTEIQVKAPTARRIPSA